MACSEEKNELNLEKHLLGKNNIPHCQATALRKIANPWIQCCRWGIPQSVFLW
jgi:hypothetical protein